MMRPPGSQWFHDTVSAMLYSLAGEHASPDNPALQPPYNDLTAFVIRQHARMPDYLRMPIAAATLGFNIMGPLNGRSFHKLHPAQRSRVIQAWKEAGLSVKRDLVRYFESLGTLALYSRQDPKLSASPEMSSALTGKGVLNMPESDLKCEIAVIGSGPGGSITACLLAEAGRDVLLIEEGPALSLQSCMPFSALEMEQKYRSGGQTVAMGSDKIAYVEGRCVGGGSEINSGLYHRTPPEILARWREDYQVRDSTEVDLKPHFEACEKDVSVSLLDGPAPTASLRLHDGAEHLGWTSLEVPRWFKPDPKVAGGGVRQSMTQTYIPRFLNASGRILPNTSVRELRKNSGAWTLVCRAKDGSRLKVNANSVFVCAGAVHTPALLRRSGFSINVGNSLQLHPTVKITARFDEEVNSERMGVPVHQVKEFSPRLSFGCSISSPAYLALGMIDHPEFKHEVRENWRTMANYYVMSAAGGLGTVRPLPIFHDPLVRYNLTTFDRVALADGVRKLAALLFEAGAVALYPSMRGGRALLQRDDVKKLPEVLEPGLASLMTIHLFSSCPMGEHRGRCAADSFGKVHGQQNLYVNDASLLCTAPGVNPQGTIMALARRNALKYLGKL